MPSWTGPAEAAGNQRKSVWIGCRPPVTTRTGRYVAGFTHSVTDP